MFATSLRLFRTVVGVVSATVLASLLTVGTTAAPAHGDDLLPYVPWSSYLDGWTDE